MMPEHGTYNRYRTWACRCDRCREATRIYYSKHARLERVAARMRKQYRRLVAIREGIRRKQEPKPAEVAA